MPASEPAVTTRIDAGIRGAFALAGLDPAAPRGWSPPDLGSRGVPQIRPDHPHRGQHEQTEQDQESHSGELEDECGHGFDLFRPAQYRLENTTVE